MRLRRDTEFKPFIITIESPEEFTGLWDLTEDSDTVEAKKVKRKLNDLITLYDWIGNKESIE